MAGRHFTEHDDTFPEAAPVALLFDLGVVGHHTQNAHAADLVVFVVDEVAPSLGKLSVTLKRESGLPHALGPDRVVGGLAVNE